MIFAALSALLTNANQQKQNHGAERSESEVRLGFRIRTFTLGGSFVNACSLLWVARDMGHMAHLVVLLSSGCPSRLVATG